MLSLLVENKIASAGGVLTLVGIILLVVGAQVPTGEVEGDIDQVQEKANNSKKMTLNGVGGALVSTGSLLLAYFAYTKFKGGSSSSSFDMSSSEMSSSDLESFQERVAAAASNLRRSMEEASASSSSSYAQSGESSAELAARASAQISSFIQNYS